jgi:hypothetical protein
LRRLSGCQAIGAHLVRPVAKPCPHGIYFTVHSGVGSRNVTEASSLPFVVSESARNRAAVFEAVCDKLELAACHKATQTVAKIIIELEQRGVREPAMLREMALTLFSQRREV